MQEIKVKEEEKKPVYIEPKPLTLPQKPALKPKKMTLTDLQKKDVEESEKS